MSALADLLAAQGKQVSGSDLSAQAVCRLTGRGIRAAVGHRAQQVGDAQLVVITAAAAADNPEIVEARRRGLPVLTHAQALGDLMQARSGVAVAGTHGKTTTTAMLGYLLEQAGLDPTVLVGATALNFGSGARLGRGPHLVAEADEYDRRFLALKPHLAIITGIEADHLDYFTDLDEIVGAFHAFVDRVAPDGVLVTAADDPVLAQLRLQRRRVSYGLAAQADWRTRDFRPLAGGGCEFSLVGPLGRSAVMLRLSGLHNALNATGAVAAACELGVPFRGAAAALADFTGTERRFETVWRSDNIWLVDDYAHHPTAVRATLAAARQVHSGRLWAVFQPHTANRVAVFFEELADSLRAADRVTVLPIYQPPGREQNIPPISSADLAAAVHGPDTSVARSLEDAESELAAEVRPGDLVVVLGAGDVTRLSRGLAQRLASRPAGL